MNRLKSVFVGMLVGLVITFVGCSFKKNSTETSPQTFVKQKEVEAVSYVQKNILAAIEQNNLQLLNKALDSAQASDLDFGGQADTPVGVALRTGNAEIMKVLVQRNVDIFRLGVEQEKFVEEVLHSEIQSLVFNDVDDSGGRGTLRESAEVLYVAHEKILKLVFTTIGRNQWDEAKSQITSRHIGLDWLEAVAILKAQRRWGVGMEVISFLQSYNYATDSNPKVIQALYEAEIFRGIQRAFQDPQPLVYLLGHPRLRNKMWNIGGSGIWLSPRFVMEAAVTENAFAEIPLVLCEEYLSKCPKWLYKKSIEKIIKDNNIPSLDYDLIYMREGRLVVSYVRGNPSEYGSLLGKLVYQRLAEHILGKGIVCTSEDLFKLNYQQGDLQMSPSRKTDPPVPILSEDLPDPSSN